MRNIILFILFLFLWNFVFSLPKVSDILNYIDKNMELRSDISAKVNITQQKNNSTKVFEIIYFRRDSDDSFLMVFNAPESERGNGYLKSGENMWMYRKNTRTFQHINRDENISGTDTKAGDFEKRKLNELYEAVLDSNNKEMITETKLGKIEVYRFELKAKVNDVTYPYQTIYVRKDNYLPLKVESYSLSKTLMQTSYYLKYTMIDNKYICINQMFVDEFEKGNKSVVEISEISTKKLSDSIFTKAYLENLSK